MDLCWQSNVSAFWYAIYVCNSFSSKENASFMAVITIWSDLEPKIKVMFPFTVFIVSPSICHEVMGTDAKILAFWMLTFKSIFSLSSFTYIKRLFSSSSLSNIRVVWSAYLRLLILLPAILFQAYAPSSLALHMLYSAYKLNKQGDNIQPCCTPLLIWSHSIVPWPVLSIASWHAYRFLRRQVRWSTIPISWRIFHTLFWSTESKGLE